MEEIAGAATTTSTMVCCPAKFERTKRSRWVAELC